MEFFVIIIIAAVAYHFYQKFQQNKNVITFNVSTSTDYDDEEEYTPRNYDTNLNNLSCSCPDYKDGRSSFDLDDPRRLCKHLIRKVIENNVVPETMSFYKDGLTKLCEYNKGFPRSEQCKFTVGNKPLVIFVPINRDKDELWIDVYYEGTRFGYKPHGHRWAHSEIPEPLEPILRLIHEKIGDPIPDSLPIGSLITESTTKRGNEYIIKCNVDGVSIKANINTRANKWIHYKVNTLDGSFDFKTEHNNTPYKYFYMDKAISKWLIDERERVMQEGNDQGSAVE